LSKHQQTHPTNTATTSVTHSYMYTKCTQPGESSICCLVVGLSGGFVALRSLYRKQQLPKMFPKAFVWQFSRRPGAEVAGLQLGLVHYMLQLQQQQRELFEIRMWDMEKSYIKHENICHWLNDKQLDSFSILTQFIARNWV